LDRTLKKKKILKIVAKIFISLVSIFVIMLFILGVYNAISKFFFKNPMPKIFGYASAIVTSGSMEPEISVDDLVIIKSQEQGYKVGEIITYKHGNSFVTHRIVDISEENYIAQGDANNTPDDPVASENVIGKVVGKIEGIGKVLGWFQTPVGIAVALIILLALLFSDSIVAWIKKSIKARNKKEGKIK
jgi:signal peptidase